jgi:hypothetical protein
MLSKWAADFSISTWNRIRDSNVQKGLKTNETTITQNMIYDLFQLNCNNIIIEEAENEAVNGNDLDLYINDSRLNKFRHFAVQAKISNKKEIYQTINHKKDNRFQILDLIDYSKETRAIPTYFFYSYTNKYNDEDIHRRGFTYNEFGIIVKCASSIFWDYFDWNPDIWKFKKIPSVCDIIEEEDSYAFRDFLSNTLTQYKIEKSIFEPIAFAGTKEKFLTRDYYFDFEEISKDCKWIKIKKPDKSIQITDTISSNSFNPKYRIIII